MWPRYAGHLPGSFPVRCGHLPESGPRLPSSRRVLAGSSVHRFPEQVGVTGMPAIFLDQVAHEPTEAGMGAVGPGSVDELTEPAVSQGRAEPAAGALDGVVPQRVELL